MSFGYCPKCKKTVGSQYCSDEEGIWRCSKCDSKLKPPVKRKARPRSEKGRRTPGSRKGALPPS